MKSIRKVSSLVLIRHGKSLRNLYETSGPFYENDEQRAKVGIFRDRLMPLVEEGQEQARRTGRKLKEMMGAPDYFYHSGFERTKQTTAEILKAYNSEETRQIDVIEDHRVRERNPGYLWNFTVAEVNKFFPWWEDYWRKADPFITFPLGGESIASMCEGRLSEFLGCLDERLPKRSALYHDNKIWIVSHGRAILGLRYLLENWSYERIHSALRNENPPNCSATCYEFNHNGRPVLSFANKVFWQP